MRALIPLVPGSFLLRGNMMMAGVAAIAVLPGKAKREQRHGYRHKYYGNQGHIVRKIFIMADSGTRGLFGFPAGASTRIDCKINEIF